MTTMADIQGMRIFTFLMVAVTALVLNAQTQSGFASWYGQPFHGRRTASGEIFDMNQMTAAHRTLPFGTEVEVTLVSTGRSVVVRVNDRGPFVENRIIDLSQAAARQIGLMPLGVGRVEMRVLGPSVAVEAPQASPTPVSPVPITPRVITSPAPIQPVIVHPSPRTQPSGQVADVWIQLIALSNAERARAYARGVAANDFQPQIRQEGRLFRVFLALHSSELPLVESRLAQAGYKGWQTRRSPVPGTAVDIY